MPEDCVIKVVSDLVHKRTTGGVTALMSAAETDRLQVVYFLLEHGANPLEVNRMGHTARDYAKSVTQDTKITRMIERAEVKTRNMKQDEKQ